MEITYSFIIPHKNSPELLDRCLNSIPRREDVQIVVVDDCSRQDVVNKIRESLSNERCTELLLTKGGRGAGYARNKGLQYAKGKWILFADADDCYCEDFLSVLDQYANRTDIDVVYYDYYRLRVNGKKEKANYITTNSNSVDRIKYQTKAPWNKMILKKFIIENNIHFEEVLNGNDVFFSFQVGMFAHKILTIQDSIYIYISNPKGITRNRKNPDEYYLCQFKHRYQTNEFYKFICHREWRKSWLRLLLLTYRNKGLNSFFQSLKVYIANRKEIVQEKMFFVNYFTDMLDTSEFCQNDNECKTESYALQSKC